MAVFKRLREKYAKLESQKDTLIDLNKQLDQLVKTYQVGSLSVRSVQHSKKRLKNQKLI